MPQDKPEVNINLPSGFHAWSDWDKALYRIRARWLATARPNQLPPLGDWAIWLLNAGRGFGKTRTAAEHCVYKGMENAGWRVGVIAPTFSAVRDVCFEGESGILNVIRANTPDQGKSIIERWNRSTAELFLMNDTIMKGYAGDEPERLRGPQFNLCWVDELAAMERQVDAFANIEMCTRLMPDPRIIITTTPKPTETIKQLIRRSKTREERRALRDADEERLSVTVDPAKKGISGTRKILDAAVLVWQ